ncbi:MAG: HD domain-containing phosphohydrolase [Erysipelotrichaceae bacterium]
MIIDALSLLTESIVLLIALFVLLKVFPAITHDPSKNTVYLGVLLGAFGVLIMAFTNHLNPNAVFDARSIFLPLIPMMFGLSPALVAAGIMLIYRIILGGGGIVLGVLIIAVASVIGLLASGIFGFKPTRRKAMDYWMTGLMVHLVLLTLVLSQSQETFSATLNELGVQVLLIYPLLTMIAGKLFDEHILSNKAQEFIRQAEIKYRKIFDQAPIGVGYTTLAGEFVEVNDQCASMLGFMKDDIKRLSFSDITHAEDLDRQIEKITAINAGEISNFTLDQRFLTSNGSIFWAHLSAAKIRFANDQPEYLMWVIQDITRKKESELFMEYIAYHDQLTDCYNGRYYEEFIERQNDIEAFPISLIRINVNGLKLINEKFNHRTGDALLQTVAKTIKQTCRESAMIARIGSNEFIIVYKNQTKNHLRKFVSVLNHAFDDETVEGMKVSVSLGYATWENPDADYGEIYKLAESRMHSEEVVTKNSMYSKTIDIIINSLFEKNNREMLHSQRVSVICEKLAKKMNFDQKSVEKIKIAGLMHDIGKIGISDEILNKEGRLNVAERIQIEKHSDAGYRILSSATEFSEIAECVLTHHERWDGHGYPKGLSGTDIPIFSRIIAVADSFDAMTSKRTYREAMDIDRVIDEMKDNAGKQFDPNIVGLFLDNIEEFREIV